MYNYIGFLLIEKVFISYPYILMLFLLLLLFFIIFIFRVIKKNIFYWLIEMENSIHTKTFLRSPKRKEGFFIVHQRRNEPIFSLPLAADVCAFKIHFSSFLSFISSAALSVIGLPIGFNFVF